MNKKYFGRYVPVAILLICFIMILYLTHPPKNIVTEISDEVTVTVMGHEYNFQTSIENPIESVYSLTSEIMIPISVSEFSGITVQINGIPFLSGEHKQILLDKLGKDVYIAVTFYDLTGQQIGEAKLQSFPNQATLWSINTTAENKPGNYYFDCGQYVYKINEKGEILYYRDFGVPVSRFLPHDVDGKRYYSVAVEAGEASLGQRARGKKVRTAWMIFDDKYQVIDWIEYMVPSNYVSENQPIEPECCVLLGEGHYLLAGYVGCRVYNLPQGRPKYGVHLSAAVLQEVKDGEVVFEWYSTDVPELYTVLHSDKEYYDSDAWWLNYAPLEAVNVDAEGRFCCYFEGIDVIAEIDRQSGQTALVQRELSKSTETDIRLRQDAQNGIWSFAEYDTDKEEVRLELFASDPISHIYKELSLT